MENRHKDSCTTRPFDDGMTQEDNTADDRKCQSKRVGRSSGKSGLHKAKALRDVDPQGEANCMIPHCQEKLPRRYLVSVPQTDTGGLEEYSKALG